MLKEMGGSQTSTGPASTPPASSATVVYDGECPFCRRWAERLGGWGRDTVRVVPLQNPRAQVITGKPVSELLRAMHFVRADGAVFVGARAVREALVHVRWGWLIRAVTSVPGSMAIAGRVYAKLAARRRRVGCYGQHCAVSHGSTPHRRLPSGGSREEPV